MLTNESKAFLRTFKCLSSSFYFKGSTTILGTSIKFQCPLKNWYFNYSVPANLTSFYYSKNINNSTLTCNAFG